MDGDNRIEEPREMAVLACGTVEVWLIHAADDFWVKDDT